MGFFFHHNRSKARTKSRDRSSSQAVENINIETHQNIDKANQAASDLNSLLRANGITLNISIATGGHHHET